MCPSQTVPSSRPPPHPPQSRSRTLWRHPTCSAPGWYAADAAGAAPGKTIVVVGDGAVGLSAVIGAKQLGAEKIIIMSRNPERQALAKEFGATHIVEERGEEGIAKVMELTDGVGAHGVAEAVGTQQSFDQALGCVRHGGYIGFVGVPHDSSIGTDALFGKQVHLEGRPRPRAQVPADPHRPDLQGRN